MGFDIDLLGPPEENDTLAHYGVKGMRWGVRKKYVPTGQETTTEEYKAATPYKSKVSPTVELRNNFETFYSKTDPSGGDPAQGLTSEQKKKLAYAAVGTLAVAGAIGYGAYKVQAGNQKPPGLPIDFFPEKVFLDQRRLETSYFADRSFDNPEVAKYFSSLQKSTAQTWMGTGMIQSSSWDRKGFELPVGHQFNRLSHSIETNFGIATYSTHSTADFNRYVLAFQQSSKQGTLHHVTWNAEKPIKVPDLTSTLNSLQKAMSDMTGRSVSTDSVIYQYESLTRDNNWDSPLAKKFFAELKSRGYSAIVDEMDYGVVSESPLIMFDHSGMGPKKTVTMTEQILKERMESIRDFPKPPRK